MNASLNEKLRAVKWGEYKLGDLFEINPTKYYRLANDKILSKSGITPLVSNASIANGVMGFSNLNPLNRGIHYLVPTQPSVQKLCIIKRMII